jgi:hypothetical protein
MVEMYKHVNNTIINAYWEARLPNGYNKPGQNASSHEVESFIRDKYINKRWVDTSMSADPAYLYWNDRKKFDKYIKKLTTEGGSAAGADAEEDSDDGKKKKKKSKKSKKSKKDHSDESEEEVMPGEKSKGLKPPTSITASIPHKVAAPLDDLINLDAPSVNTKPTTSTGFDMGFTDF